MKWKFLYSRYVILGLSNGEFPFRGNERAERPFTMYKILSSNLFNQFSYAVCSELCFKLDFDRFTYLIE